MLRKALPAALDDQIWVNYTSIKCVLCLMMMSDFMSPQVQKKAPTLIFCISKCTLLTTRDRSGVVCGPAGVTVGPQCKYTKCKNGLLLCIVLCFPVAHPAATSWSSVSVIMILLLNNLTITVSLLTQTWSSCGATGFSCLLSKCLIKFSWKQRQMKCDPSLSA